MQNSLRQFVGIVKTKPQQADERRWMRFRVGIHLRLLVCDGMNV